jgi:hypothetical protein
MEPERPQLPSGSPAMGGSGLPRLYALRGGGPIMTHYGPSHTKKYQKKVRRAPAQLPYRTFALAAWR